MANISNDLIREYIQESLKEYAAFFVHLVEGTEDEARQAVNVMRLVDEKAKQTLTDIQLKDFRTRKSSLMGIFKDRLFEELRGQVQDDVLIRAQELVAKLEQPSPQ